MTSLKPTFQVESCLKFSLYWETSLLFEWLENFINVFWFRSRTHLRRVAGRRLTNESCWHRSLHHESILRYPFWLVPLTCVARCSFCKWCIVFSICLSKATRAVTGLIRKWKFFLAAVARVSPRATKLECEFIKFVSFFVFVLIYFTARCCLMKTRSQCSRKNMKTVCHPNGVA